LCAAEDLTLRYFQTPVERRDPDVRIFDGDVVFDPTLPVTDSTGKIAVLRTTRPRLRASTRRRYG
jgi:hypothetical protein